MSVEKGTLTAYVERFNRQQRFQHILLAVSVLVLIITGFPIKYGHTAYARFMVSLFGTFERMFTLHLVAAVIMLVAAAYHVIWLVLNAIVQRSLSSEMLPSFKDFRDATHHIKYLLGAVKEPPRFGRYTYLEKFEYFAVIWGITFMGGTGIFLWAPDLAARFFPRWLMDVFRVIHSNEAVVALIALGIGHFFAAHFNPDIFPSSRVWYDGKISLYQLAGEHPEEYARLVEAGVIKLDARGQPVYSPPGRFARSKALILTELVIYSALFIALLVAFVPQFVS